IIASSYPGIESRPNGIESFCFCTELAGLYGVHTGIIAPVEANIGRGVEPYRIGCCGTLPVKSLIRPIKRQNKFRFRFEKGVVSRLIRRLFIQEIFTASGRKQQTANQ